MVAKNISQSFDKLTDAAQQVEVRVRIATKFQDRFEYFSGKLGIKGFSDGMPCDGTNEEKRNRFYSAMGSLHLYSEDMSMDELDDKAFPDFKAVVPGEVNFSASVTPLLPLISQRVGFVFSALPFRARIFAFRLFDILSCENTGCYGWTNQ